MFHFLNKLFVTSKKHSNRRPLSKRAQLAIESLEARELMTTTILGSLLGTGPVNKINPAQGWIDQNIHDPAIHALVTSYDGDTVLSRNEMLAIFNQVRNDAYQASGLTATELSDLRALVSNPNVVGMPGYVANLANKVVNFDPADLHYQGGTLEVNAGLRVGDSGTLLNNLTNKWFLGLDHPALPDSFDSNNQLIPGSSAAFHYQLAAGSLFGSGIGYADIMQGQVADCFFLAPLESAAVQRPAVVTNMFIDNGDGTFTVRFYNNGSPDYVTVDRYLPADGNGKYVADNQTRNLSDSSNKLWVALAEKAYAQLAESGWSRAGTNDPAKQVNAYDSINFGDPAVALSQTTGFQASAVSNFLRDGHPLTSADVISDFQHGALIVLTTDNVTANAPSHVRSDVVPNHVYPMISYFTSGNLLVLDNPWAPGSTTYSQTLVGSWETMQDTGLDHIGWGFASVVEVSFEFAATGPLPTGTTQKVGAASTAAVANVQIGIRLPATLTQDPLGTHPTQSADPLPTGPFTEVHPAMLYFADLRKKSDDRAAATDPITALSSDWDAVRLGVWEARW
jgi:hypothetical protein